MLAKCPKATSLSTWGGGYTGRSVINNIAWSSPAPPRSRCRRTINKLMNFSIMCAPSTDVERVHIASADKPVNHSGTEAADCWVFTVSCIDGIYCCCIDEKERIRTRTADNAGDYLWPVCSVTYHALSSVITVSHSAEFTTLISHLHGHDLLYYTAYSRTYFQWFNV